jgi:hypothetical protein
MSNQGEGKKKTERQVLNAIKKILADADEARGKASEIRRSFGECPAFHDKHWEAYYKEESAEYFANGNRPI